MTVPLPLPIEDFTARVIEDGIAAAVRDYGEGTPQARGAVAGFEACRGKDPPQLAALLVEARRETREARLRARQGESATALFDEFWFWSCRELEIEWVCNVLSAALANEGRPVIVPPTARGVMKAAEIVGVG